jgi:hypothetical protein
MKMGTYRVLTAIGAMAAVAVWGVMAPAFVEMTRVGAISPVALLLMLVAVVSLAMGALRVWFGKGARAAFVVHIAFAVAAAVMMKVCPVAPLALSLAVAVVALVWSSASGQYPTGAARETREGS